MTALPLDRSRLRPADLLRVGSVGLQTRRLRAALSAVGIAIGIAAMVAVLGISESSKADLVATLDRLGTNLLSVQAGQGLFGEASQLPEESTAMISRIGPVQAVAGIVPAGVGVYRSDYIPSGETGGVSAVTASVGLLDTVSGAVAGGRFLDAASERLPTVVLGAKAAEVLGIREVSDGVMISIGGEWFVVIGILKPLELASELDRAVLIGQPVAARLFDTQANPSTIYVRADPEQIEAVRDVLARTANPGNPEEVQVSRPSDALEARAAVNDSYTSLFLGLGAVALLVGGIGIANVMVISVLERQSEIGLRRALGARRRHVLGQFLTESLLLAGLGGLVGVAGGVAITAAYARTQGWAAVVPAYGIVGGVAAALAIGGVAGLYPAMRAARLSPTEALRSA